ncbi:MAG: hypothetical protein RR998_04935 [Oscillospiraceae bacterium]
MKLKTTISVISVVLLIGLTLSSPYYLFKLKDKTITNTPKQVENVRNNPGLSDKDFEQVEQIHQVFIGNEEHPLPDIPYSDIIKSFAEYNILPQRYNDMINTESLIEVKYGGLEDNENASVRYIIISEDDVSITVGIATHLQKIISISIEDASNQADIEMNEEKLFLFADYLDLSGLSDWSLFGNTLTSKKAELKISFKLNDFSLSITPL